ncbi:acyltransferase [Pseudoalteromonas sp. Q18-MNA-CIBAN-0097]|uniref:acyltransferase family protein n=1 Tax=Pseudoalteromonas sp. Q18-MNA-CIBAN-0097 TaxID=3140440 RepID=UPI00332735D4
MNKIYSLQILRAFAAWLVVYHHYMQLFYNFESKTLIGNVMSTRGGFGVDLFFILSGLVMYLVSKSTTITATSFFVKRVTRVAPAYWFYTSILIVLLFIFPKEFGFTDFNAESLIKSYFLIPSQNPSGIGLFPVLTVGWTLIFEMAFYTILAISIGISKKYSVLICSSLVIFLSLFFPEGNLYTTVLGSSQICQFLFGFAIGFYFRSDTFKKFNNLFSSYTQAFVLLTVALIMLSGVLGFGLIHKTIAASCIVLSCILLDSKFSYSNWLAKFLIKSGDYSYSIYLSHVLVLGVLLHFAGNNFSMFQEVGILLTLTVIVHCISSFSYKYIENGAIPRVLNRVFIPQTKSRDRY